MKTITVKGIGKASIKPDHIEISISIETHDMNYDAALQKASEHINKLSNEIVAVGHDKDALKTDSFDVRVDYKNERDKDGSYHQKFNGFVCNHSLKLGFDFSNKMLSETLGAVINSLVEPNISIAFTVKDTSAVEKILIADAAKNAKKKAKLLCASSGVTLGELQTIDYNWQTLNTLSETRCLIKDEISTMRAATVNLDIAPKDIDLSDTATFVWEIK